MADRLRVHFAAAVGEPGFSVDRRWAIKAAGATGVAAVLAGRGVTAGALDLDAAAASGDGDRGAGVEPGAGGWRTWALSSGSEIAVPAPPKGNAAKADLNAVEAAVGARDEATLDAIGFWDTGWHGYRWMQIAMQAVSADPVQDTFRVAAYTAVAIHDATIATWAAKQRYRRKRPYEQKKSLSTIGVRPDSPSYPSEHGAAAGAAIGVLSHLYPAQAAGIAAKAAAHAEARVAAGLEFPSDFAAGLEVGKQAAARLVATQISVDGFGAPYPGNPDAPYPGGDESFPVLPKDEGFQIMIGKWKPLVLDDVTAFRPPPPPVKGSQKRAEELAEVKAYPRRTPPTFSELFFWAEDPAGRPEPDSDASVNPVSAAFYYAVDVAFIALEDLNRAVLEYRLDANPPRAARAVRADSGRHARRLHRLLGVEVPLPRRPADPLRPDRGRPVGDLPAGRLPLRPLVQHDRGGDAAGLSVPPRRPLLPQPGQGERGVAFVGGHPLPQRLRVGRGDGPTGGQRHHRVGKD